MKVQTTRTIDYWVGIPLCALMSLWRFIVERLLPRGHRPLRRVLFIELSEMGSAILAYPSIVELGRCFPESEAYFLIFRQNRESVDVLGIIPPDRVLTIDERTFGRFIVTALWAVVRIRWLRIDTTLDLELFSRCTALLSYLSGAERRVGFSNYTAEGLYRGKLLTHEVYYNPHRHMSLNFLALVRALTETPGELPLLKADVRGGICPLPRHRISEERRQSLFQLLLAEGAPVTAKSRLVLLNPDPGPVLPIRGWPVENFAALATELLLLHPEIVVIIIGLKESAPFAEKLLALVETSLRARVVDFTGRTHSLVELLDLIALARALVTNDSGPAHLCSLTDTANIVFFGPETPLLYAPLGDRVRTLYSHYSCSPCLSAANHRNTICRNNRCLQAIPVAQALEAVRSAIL